MRESPKVQDYINHVVLPISDEAAKNETALEIRAHLEERIEFYKEIGYDDVTAEKKAIEDMGDPEPVGASLSRLHPKGRVITAVLAVLPLVLYIVSWLSPVPVARLYSFIRLGSQGLWFGVWEIVPLLYLLWLSRFGKKRGNRFLCALPVLAAFAYGGWYAFWQWTGEPVLLCSPALLSAICLLTGDLDCLRRYPYVAGVVAPAWLDALSLLFYLFVFFLLLSGWISVCRMRKPTYRLRDKKASKRLAAISRGLMIGITVVFAVSIPFFASGAAETNAATSEMTDFDTVIIIQSEEPVALDSIDCAQTEVLTVDYELFAAEAEWWVNNEAATFQVETTRETLLSPCGRTLQYSQWVLRAECAITEPYVYVGFLDVNDYEIRNDASAAEPASGEVRLSVAPEDWQKTETVGTLTRDGDSFNRVEIVINDARE